MNNSSVIESLRDSAKRHDAVYEVQTHQEVVKVRAETRIVRNGFEIRICGTHDHGHSTMTPGCDQCVTTYRDLKAIAQWVMPTEQRDSVYEIKPFDQALHIASRRLEVELALRINHRHGWEEPIDDCEKRCLVEIEHNLKSLGLRRR